MDGGGRRSGLRPPQVGLVLAATVLVVKVQNAAAKAAGTAPPEVKRVLERDHLSGWSLLVLGAMTAMLVVGLAWCFYRAIKAGGRQPEPQISEGVE